MKMPSVTIISPLYDGHCHLIIINNYNCVVRVVEACITRSWWWFSFFCEKFHHYSNSLIVDGLINSVELIALSTFTKYLLLLTLITASRDLLTKLSKWPSNWVEFGLGGWVWVMATSWRRREFYTVVKCPNYIVNKIPSSCFKTLKGQIRSINKKK